MLVWLVCVYLGLSFVGLFVPLCLDRLSFSILGKFSTIISSKIFSYPLSFSSPSGTPIIQMLVHLILPERSLRLSSILFILFILFCSSKVIFNILSSSSLICSSASDILLLILSRVFLISVMCCLSLHVYSLILLGLC